MTRTLQPEGGYIEERRHYMQAFNYTHLRLFPFEYSPAFSQRDRLRFEELSEAERRNMEQFLNRCLWLAWSVEDPAVDRAGQEEVE